MDRRIKPAAPAMAAMTEARDSSFCHSDVFLARRPVCRSQRSEIKAMSKETTVTADMAMKRGLRP